MGDLYAVEIVGLNVEAQTAMCELTDPDDDGTIPAEGVDLCRMWLRVKACAMQWSYGCCCESYAHLVLQTFVMHVRVREACAMQWSYGCCCESYAHLVLQTFVMHVCV